MSAAGTTGGREEISRRRKFAARTKSGRLSRAYRSEARDHGTRETQAKRHALINGAPVELAASASGILYANGHVTDRQYSAGLTYARLHSMVFGRTWLNLVRWMNSCRGKVDRCRTKAALKMPSAS